MGPIGAGKSHLKKKTHSPKKRKYVSRVYVYHMAVHEKHIPFDGACIIHTDLMVKQNNYKHYYYYHHYYYYYLTLPLNSASFLSFYALVWLMSTVGILAYPMEGLF